ncbi:TIGR04076 family protein [Thermanaeromonas toyohensis ToBE]|uniref:TIGR04076 family protein n=1 Tax=Thermanaeromonas toyohensis ToBE TaxID=698762 RepID=A0A1W1VFG6_9FIRM|nr:TIGR04076 family protein [Thermanaeromonas toyohensis]SMB92075.1 TIGR04076 family protein [Thermanaeromonas toyohensis ToBE]
MVKYIEGTVVSIEKECSAGLKPGYSFKVKVNSCLKLYEADGMCLELLHNAFPAIMAMAFGQLPFEKEGEALVSCPDPVSKVVIRLRRIT